MIEAESVTRLKLRIIDSAVDYAIFSMDLAGIVTTWSEGARRIFGWSADEACGQLGAIIFTAEDRALNVPEKEMGVALKEGRSIDERWHLRNDGTRLWASGEMLPLTNDEGQPTGLMKIVRDRTEAWLREQRQIALLKLGDQLANLMEWPQMAKVAAESVGSSLNGAFAIYITMKEGVPQIDGQWHGSEKSPKLESGIFPPGIFKELREGRVVAIADTGPRGVAIDNEGLAHAYAYVPVMEHQQLVAAFGIYSLAPREWTAPEVAFVAAIGARTRAAVERRKAEMALSDLAAGLEQEVEARVAERNRLWVSTSDLMATLDADLRFVDLNPAWSALLGWPLDTMMAGSLYDVLHEDSKKLIEDAVGRVCDGQAVSRVVCRLEAQDRTARLASLNLSRHGNRYYLVASDITAQVGMEERLRQSQKMDALGQLTGGIAHDFNNLLTGIIGSLDLLRIRLNSGRTEGLERFMRAARTSAHRAAALTHRLLVFARQQPLDPRPVDINALLAGMEELLRRTLHEGIRLEVVLNASRWSALTDAHQLENAILNLVINARDAMPDGGELRITTDDGIPDDDLSSSDRQVEGGGYVCVSVTDNGNGMPSDVLAKVFEPFFTTKPSGQGTGLGLSMIYGFARQSNGDVRISSEVGRGTTVRLLLPRTEHAVSAADQDTVTGTSLGQGESVFVVEDDSTVRVLLGEVLNELGYRKIEAPDGQAALSILRSDLHIDLLITDLGLPFVNGRRLADIAREQRPGLKILFITGYADNDLLEQVQRERDTWILNKPIGFDQLGGKLREIFQPDDA